jgi:hypothetical protein
MRVLNRYAALLAGPHAPSVNAAARDCLAQLKKLRRRLKDKLPEGCGRLADLDPGLVALMAVSSRAFTLD